MRSIHVKIWLSLLLVGVGGYGVFSGLGIYRNLPQTKVTETPLPSLEEITLIDANKKPFQFDQMLGKVWVANVVFTDCPHNCSAITKRVKTLHEAYPQVHFVSISCNPEKDRPELMKIWAQTHGVLSDRWHFVTGKMSDISAVGKHIFNERIKRGEHSPYAIIHDAVGLPSDQFSLNDDLARIHKALDQLTKPQSEAADPRPPEPPDDEPSSESTADVAENGMNQQ